MAKTRQVLKVDACGRMFSVVYHSGKVNPYRIYRHTYVPSEWGYLKRKSCEVKYADMRSCMYWLAQQF